MYMWIIALFVYFIRILNGRGEGDQIPPLPPENYVFVFCGPRNEKPTHIYFALGF